MTRRGPLLLSMVFLTAVCGPTLSQQSTASVEGTIVEAVSGRPMGKTTVELRSTSSTGGVIASTRTNLDGGFHLREMLPAVIASWPLGRDTLPPNSDNVIRAAQDRLSHSRLASGSLAFR